MKVIGAGFGRTGTLSMKAALEFLGLGPCHHMIDIVDRPDRVDLWLPALRGESVDWDRVFDGYQSTVDWPACDFWDQLVRKYPDAKVVLTVRDSERWYESFRETLAPTLGSANEDGAFPQEFGNFPEFLCSIGARTFDNRFDDKEHVISVFEKHNRDVRSSVPADRLLVYEVKEGWQPLCDFLGVDVPEGEEFPHLNERETFQDRAAAARKEDSGG